MIKQNLTLGTTTSKKKKNNGTGGLYGDFVGGTGSANNVSLPNLPSSNPTYGDFINIPTPSKDKTGGAYTGNDLTLNPSTPSFGYGDALGDLSVTPKKKDEQIVTPTWGTGNNSKLPPSAPSGISKDDISVAPVDKSQFFDSNVVGTVGGGFSGGKKGGITDEGEIIGNPSVDNSTFNKGNNTVPSGKLPASKSDKIPTPTIEEPVIKPSVDTIKDGSTGGKTPTPSTPAAPTTPKGEKENDSKMSYEDYINEMKKGYQEQLDAANKQAEQTKARAMANAENAYAQNKATYGTNAETLAQMGLTGGGYSDYLQAQAYAQKRADAQAASAQEIASKSNNQATYQQYITAMNEKLAEKALYEEQLEEQRKYNEQQTKAESDREYTKNIYNTLWSAVQNTNTTYTPESIKALGEKAGLSNEDITTLTNMLNATLARKTGEETKNAAYSKAAYLEALSQIQNSTTRENYSEAGIRILGKQWGWSDEQINDLLSIYKKGTGANTGSDNVSLDGSKKEDKFDYQEAVSEIRNGQFGYIDGNKNFVKYSREEAYEMCLQARNAGDITNEEVKSIMKEYDRRVAYENNKISMDEHYNAANKDAAAEKEVDKILNADYYKSKVGSYGYNPKDARDVLFTTSDKFNISQFGSYAGSGRDGKQDNYLKKIVADAKAGKIKEGQYIVANYGIALNSMGYFLYVGDGVFVKLRDEHIKGKGSTIYVPDGYHWKGEAITKI